MKVEVFRMASEPMTIEVEGDEAAVGDVLSAPGSGKVLGEPEQTLIDVANHRYGGIEGLGSLRVNGSGATLATPVSEGQTILIVPKVEGGSRR